MECAAIVAGDCVDDDDERLVSMNGSGRRWSVRQKKYGETDFKKRSMGLQCEVEGVALYVSCTSLMRDVVESVASECMTVRVQISGSVPRCPSATTERIKGRAVR